MSHAYVCTWKGQDDSEYGSLLLENEVEKKYMQCTSPGRRSDGQMQADTESVPDPVGNLRASLGHP